MSVNGFGRAGLARVLATRDRDARRRAWREEREEADRHDLRVMLPVLFMALLYAGARLGVTYLLLGH